MLTNADALLMTRACLIIISFCLCALITSCGQRTDSTTASPAQQPPKRPNILFIFTDDQSHRTVSCYPEAFDWVATPNIDRLAQRGVRFSHAYIGSWCMASRMNVLTGLHQTSQESLRMTGPNPHCEYDPALVPFWPSDFRKQGYTTAQIGKWHTGSDAGFGRDWDHQVVWNRPKNPENAPNYYDNQLTSRDGGPYEMVTGYTTDNYTDWAVDFIAGQTRTSDDPWYLWLCYGAVHGPFTPADRHLNDYQDITVTAPADVFPPRPGKPRYAQKMEFWGPDANGQPVEREFRKKKAVAMKDMPGRPLTDWVRQYHQGVKAIDESVGRLVSVLETSGQLDNTIIVFTSDQGFAWGQHGFKTKVAGYDAAIRAPLIVSYPKTLPQGTTVRTPVTGIDLVPTFYDLVGLTQPWPMHGRTLTPLLQDSNAQLEHPAMLVHTAKQYGSDAAVVPPPGDPRMYHGPGIPWYVMLTDNRYKYIRNLEAGEVEELYDLNTDPEEITNLALTPQHAERLADYRQQAIAEMRRTNVPFVDQLPAVGGPNAPR